MGLLSPAWAAADVCLCLHGCSAGLCWWLMLAAAGNKNGIITFSQTAVDCCLSPGEMGVEGYIAVFSLPLPPLRLPVQQGQRE